MNQKFQHDCDHCVFLGRHTIDSIEYDLYVCPKRNTNIISTLIARYQDRINNLEEALRDTLRQLEKAINGNIMGADWITAGMRGRECSHT